VGLYWPYQMRPMELGTAGRAWPTKEYDVRNMAIGLQGDTHNVWQGAFRWGRTKETLKAQCTSHSHR
jgi:hypothetical protein